MMTRRTPAPAAHRPPPRHVSPFAGFRSDHARVLSHLDTIETELSRARGFGARASATLGPVVEVFARQFATHMTAEDALLYPWLGETLPESRITLDALGADHSELRSLLSGIAQGLAQRAGRKRDEQLRVQLRDFVDLLRLHIRREESAVFEVADRILSPTEARELARRLQHFVSVLSPSPTTTRLARKPAATGPRERKS